MKKPVVRAYCEIMHIIDKFYQLCYIKKYYNYFFGLLSNKKDKNAFFWKNLMGKQYMAEVYANEMEMWKYLGKLTKVTLFLGQMSCAVGTFVPK